MLKRLLILMFFLCCLCNINAQTRDTLITEHIEFKVNTDSIIVNKNYYHFCNEIIPFIHNHKNNIDFIEIIGTSSPEGSIKNNKYLADKRTRKILSLIGDSIPEHKIQLTSIDEDYKSLYNIIYRSDEEYKDDVIYILSTSNNVKRDLQNLNNGKVWIDLIKKYYPKLRRSTITIGLHNDLQVIQPCDNIRDTIYVQKTDTVYLDIRKTWRKYPILSIKTNILLDVIPYSPFGISFTPNIQAEMYTWFHGLSVEFEYMFPWYHNDSNHKCYQILNGTVGIRKYFNNEYTKWYVGIYGNTGYFDLSINEEKGWQGEEHGAGLSLGYVIKKNNIRFEPYIRIGWIGGKFDPYHAGDPFSGKYYYDWYQKASDFQPRRYNINYFGPTMIGINISYDIIHIRKP